MRKMRLLCIFLVYFLPILFWNGTILTAQTFVEEASLHGINNSFLGGFGTGVSFCDFNGDGWDDLTFGSSSGSHVHFYENNNGTFQSIAPLISNGFESKNPLWVDYDNDGDKDLFLTVNGNHNKLFQNDGAMNFTDVSFSAGIPLTSGPAYGACFGDINNDGWLDLYICHRDFGGGNNYLLLSKGDGTFTDISVSSGTGIANPLSFCAAFFDYNDDGYQDLYIAMDKVNIANVLFENNGDSTFTDVSAASNSDLLMDAMNVGIGDYDNDGDLDIYITDTNTNRLLKNNGNSTFSEVAVAAGVGFYRIGWGANFFDCDNDMDFDLYVAARSNNTSEHNILYENLNNGSFSQPFPSGMIGDTTYSYGSAIGDFDNNGKLDMVVSNNYPFPSQLWKNETINTNNWLKVKLVGTTSNKDGIGSWIEVWDNGVKVVQYTRCGGNYLSQSSNAYHFGLATISTVDSVVVKWLSGIKDKLLNVGINQTITLIENSTNAALPMELLHFSAHEKENEVRLNWTTINEKNIQNYHLEKSEDGIQFEKIYTTLASNNPIKTNYYQWKDAAPHEGNNYYRIKTLDFDGSIEFSSIRNVIFERNLVLIQNIFPNPSINQNARIEFNAHANLKTNLTVFNQNGKIIFGKNNIYFHQNSSLILPSHNWETGIYFIKIANGQEFDIHKFVVLND